MRNTSLRAKSLATVLGTGLIACALSSNAAVEPQIDWNHARALLQAAVEGDFDTTAKSPSPCTLLPAEAGKWNYSVLAGDEQGKQSVTAYHPLTDEEHVGVWQILTGDNHLLSLTVSDDVAEITSVVDTSRNLLIEYIPPEPMIIAGMKPGQSVTKDIKVRVVSVSQPSQEKATGKMTLRLSYLGQIRLASEAGNFNAHVFQSDIASKVGPLDQKDTAFNFFAENTGIVARVTKMHLHAMIVYNKNKRDAYLLREKEDSGDSDAKSPAGNGCAFVAGATAP